ACSIGQRKSFSEWQMRMGVCTFSACLSGERSHMSSNPLQSESWPNSNCMNVGPMSDTPQNEIQLEMERCVMAALNRFVCVTIQLVMKPPYEPPVTASRDSSMNPSEIA